MTGDRAIAKSRELARMFREMYAVADDKRRASARAIREQADTHDALLAEITRLRAERDALAAGHGSGPRIWRARNGKWIVDVPIDGTLPQFDTRLAAALHAVGHRPAATDS